MTMADDADDTNDNENDNDIDKDNNIYSYMRHAIQYNI